MLDAAPDCVFPNRTFYDLGINNPVISVSGKHRICRRVDFWRESCEKVGQGTLLKDVFTLSTECIPAELAPVARRLIPFRH